MKESLKWLLLQLWRTCGLRIMFDTRLLTNIRNAGVFQRWIPEFSCEDGG